MTLASGRAARAVALGLLGLSISLAAAGTLLDRRVAGTRLPAGTEELGPTFLWVVLGFAVVGAVVAARRPGHPIGWLLIALGLAWQVNHAAGDLRTYLGFSRPELSGAAAAAWVFDVLWLVPVCGLPLLVLLLPTGRLPSARWRVVLVGLGAGALSLLAAVGLRPGPFTNSPTIDNPLGVAALDRWIEPLEAIGNLLIAATVLASLASLVVRYRSGDVLTRQQLKWVVAAMAVIVGALAVASALEAAGASGTTLGVIRTMPLVLLPVACGIAVLRYRLFDIDLVISKVALYSALAGGIVVLYVTVVVGVGRLVGAGDEPNVALAVAATTMAAVVFDPARRALHRLVDRAVYGRRASPYETLASMTRRVGGSYALGEVLDRMARAIAEATGGIGEVWLSSGGELSRSASWPPPEGGARAPAADAMATVRAATVPAATHPGPTDGAAAGPFEGPQAVFPVHRGPQLLGALAISKPRGEPVTPAEHRLLTDLADSAAFVLENARLVEELRASAQRLVAAQDTERRRVERDLHDGAQQRLLELALTLRRAERQASQHCSGEVSGVLAEAAGQLQQALGELRDLARGIHPAILTEQGLGPALQSLVTRLPAPAELDLDLGHRLDGPVESTAYFVASESLANVVKHAGATRVQVSARHTGGELRVEVVDDGSGGADPHGSGLQGLADRVAALGGHLQVWSSPAQGTRIEAVLPCA